MFAVLLSTAMYREGYVSCVPTRSVDAAGIVVAVAVVSIKCFCTRLIAWYRAAGSSVRCAVRVHRVGRFLR